MTTKEDAAKYKEDVAKYYCALGSRSIRRVAAEAYNARESDPAALVAIMAELTQAVKWQQMAALASFDHHFDDEQEEKTIEIDWAVYSDGRPVFTVVDWLDGYASVVHRPDSFPAAAGDTSELAPEICPCCGGMPSVE